MRFLSVFLLCGLAAAQTTITDTIKVGDASAAFNGRVIVTSPSMVCGGISYRQWQTEVKVAAGAFSIALWPSAACEPRGIYSVRFIPERGSEWTEYWIVPAASAAIALKDVIQAVVPLPTTTIPVEQLRRGSAAVGQHLAVLESGLWGPSSANVSNVFGRIGAVVAQSGDYTTAQITESDNLWFTSERAQAAMMGLYEVPLTFSGVLSRSTNTITCPSCIVSSSFVDDETPAGTLNGTNTVFTLAAAPSPAASLLLFRNGLRLRAGADFTLSGSTITFVTGAVPSAGDILTASYRTN